MGPNHKFLDKKLSFWANIRTISEAVGYTKRQSGNSRVCAYRVSDILQVIEELRLNKNIYFKKGNKPTQLTKNICDYSKYRADILNNTVAKSLMDKDTAKKLFQTLMKKYNSQLPIPMNKQRGKKKEPSYFTAMINIILEHTLRGKEIDYNPKKLIKVFNGNKLEYTFSRRVDGAFPSIYSPKAIWEIKEYYHTTTFGSRVADAIYETQLDGFELDEVWNNTGIKIYHYLFVDDYRTWWEQGRSYLCRIVDMLHMGKVDEVIFGKEILKAIPRIVKKWS